MAKKKASENPNAQYAMHQIHYVDPDFGPSVVKVGDEIPEGVFSDEQRARLVAKRAITASGNVSAKSAKVATSDDLDEITGTAGDDGLGDVGEEAKAPLSGVDASEGGEGSGGAGIPSTKPSATRTTGKKK